MLAALAAVESYQEMRVVEELFAEGDVNAKAGQVCLCKGYRSPAVSALCPHVAMATTTISGLLILLIQQSTKKV